MACLSVFLSSALPAQLKTTLSPASAHAFDEYVKNAEAGLDWQPQIPVGSRRISLIPGSQNSTLALPDAIIHDWRGGVLAPGAQVSQVLAVLQSYDSYERLYAPEITESKILSHQGDHWKIYLKLYKKAFFTANLESEYAVEYRPVGNGRWAMLSRSTKIVEEEGGVPLPEGTGHGYLWRLNAYWLLEQRPEGVYMECRAISMSRDVPAGLGWALKPIIAKLPRQSLRDTLEATLRALNR